jgi:hypothetical protein
MLTLNIRNLCQKNNFSFVEGYFVLCVPLGVENVQIRDRPTG